MAKLYGEILSSALMTFDKSFARANGQPLDSTEVYYSLVAAKEYAATDVAYIGQKIVVIEGGKITHYSIEDAEGNLKELGAKPVGDEKSIVVAEDGTVSLKGVEALVFERDILGEDDQPTGEKETIQYQPLMTKDGLVWVEPSKTTVEGLATLIDALTKRVDTAEDEIDALQEAVGVKASEGVEATGLYKEIADEKARALAAEKALGERIDGIDYVDNDELTTALGSYVTTESFNTFKSENTQAIADAKSGAEQTAANALSTARTEISKEIDDDVKVAKDRADAAYTLAEGKVDAGTYATDKKALQDEDAAIRAIAEAAKSSIDTFLDGEGVADVVDSLKDIQAELDKMAESTELVDALALKADKSVVEGIEGRVKAIEDAPYVTKSQLNEVDGKFASYTNTESLTTLLAGKQDVIPENTYDAYGAAATAKSEAIEDAEGKIATAKQEAIDAAATAAAGIYATQTALGNLEVALDERLDTLEAYDHSTYATKEELTAHGTAADGKYATKDELKTTDDKAVSNANSITNLTSRLDGIVAQGGEPNVINNIKVNGVVQTITDKAVDITVPTKFSDITDDSGFDARITAAQNQADKGVNDASAAQSTANEAKTAAANNATALGELNTTVTGHTTSINGHATRLTALEDADRAHAAEYTALKGIVDGHTTSIAGKAAQTDLDKAVARVAANESAIKTLNETTIVNLDNTKANKVDVYTKEQIGTLAKDDEGKEKTIVQMIEEAKSAAISGATYDDSKVKEDIQKNADAISSLVGNDSNMSVRDIAAAEINTLIGGVSDADTITGITTLIEYVNANGGNVTGIQKDISDLKGIVAGIGGEGQPATVLALVEQEIAEIPLAGLVKGEGDVFTAFKGLILPEENKFEMVDGKVTAVSTDLLTQGSNTLILHGGDSNF